eukprot:CAMPEP_0204838512 /NCGR_PEP_ID=MMETSP1346-20131115/31267_1 /ASSEMBLY_ACC=CAM_ASM_000771 /TAXON_ID=215587 /ORGANISM="Aplanochytrium stocchinoi, Strain GSBS06" /LENGTH=106 /DNA_ID=CAMNT_0051974643 /DNA_START=89 /DNA_END=406 /DNA_ORIENTATION=-
MSSTSASSSSVLAAGVTVSLGGLALLAVAALMFQERRARAKKLSKFTVVDADAQLQMKSEKPTTKENLEWKKFNSVRIAYGTTTNTAHKFAKELLQNLNRDGNFAK